MAKKVFKTFFRIAEFLFGFVIILLLLLFIRLSTGPIEIKNLTPMIVDSFTAEEQDVQVNIKDAYIEFAFSRGRLMDIRLDELDVSDADGFVLTVQKANVSFNPFWLLLGKLALRDIDLESPYIQVNLGEGRSQKKQSETLGRQLHRVRKYAERLDALKITDAQFVLTKKGNAFVSLPNLNVEMSKNFLDEISLNATADVYFNDVFSKLKVDALYDLDTKKMDFKTTINDLNLSKLENLSAYLNNSDFIVDFVAEGNLNLAVLKLGWEQSFEQLLFEVKTQNVASVYLPKPVDTTYQVDNFLIKGKILPQLSAIELTDSLLSISGNTSHINLFVTNLQPYLRTNNVDDLNVSLNVSLSDIPMKDVPNLWPATLGSSAHSWVKENVLEGKVDNAVLDLTFRRGNLDNFISQMNISDAVVRYVDEMMPLTKGRVQVTFETKQIKMDVLGGNVGKLQITGGYVNFLDLDKETPRFDMDVQFAGKITDGLSVVSTPPLNVCDMIQIPCQQMTGFAKGTVKLAFPFFDEGIEHFITYSVQADLEEAGFSVPKTDWHISQGNFKLFVNNDKLTLDGRALLDDNPISLDVVKSFKDNDENASLYRVKLPLTVSMLTPYFGHIGDFFKGSLLTDITVYPQDENETMVNIDVGLKDAEVSLPIGYTKEFNQDGVLKATLTLKNDKLVDIPSVYLSIPDEKISLKGSVQLPKDKLFVLDLSEIKSPRTEAQAKISIINENTFDIAVFGKSLDVFDLLHGRFWSNDKTISQTPINFKIQGNIDTLYLSDKEPFKNVRLSLEKQDGHWNAMDGALVGAVPFTFSLNEEKNALNIQTDDVGDFLRRAGFTDRIKGGHLNTMISQDEKGQLSGELWVQNYELTDTGFFMQAATLLGIVDALRGNTIAFDKAIIPFTLSTLNDLEIKDAVASGTAVGFTLRGNIQNDAIDFNGSVVPAYALNSLPGKIPVIGTLLSGEEGGGLIGVSYHVGGNTDNPEFSFNPASLLTPGIFRRLFSAF